MVTQVGVHPQALVPAAPVLALGAVGAVPGSIGVVEGGTIPYQPWAAAQKKDNAEHWLDETRRHALALGRRGRHAGVALDLPDHRRVGPVLD